MGQDLAKLWPVENKFIRILQGMERRGVRLNQELCAELSAEAHSEMARVTEELGFDPGSSNALAEFLFETLGLPILARGKPSKSFPNGRPKMDKERMNEYDSMLDANDDPSAKMVLAFRGWQKANSVCYEGYPRLVSVDGRLRPSYKIHGTKTTRLSCEKPNLQQIPRSSDKPWNGRIKRLFVPDDGFRLIEFDYSTLEFRLAALYANEKDLIDRINAGADFHQITADLIRELAGIDITRQEAKTTNFLILYGGGVGKLAWQLHATPEKAQLVWDAYHETFPGFKKVMDSAARTAKNRGYVNLWTGRRRHFNTKWSFDYEDGIRKEPYHKAFNSLCQGGGAEIVKHAMLRVDPLNSDSARLLLQVHDSLVWEIREDCVQEVSDRIKSEMERVGMKINFTVDAHEWGKAA